MESETNAYNPVFGSGGSLGGYALLVALHGASTSPLQTDVGAGNHGLAAFNGIYTIYPSADRMPKTT